MDLYDFLAIAGLQTAKVLALVGFAGLLAVVGVRFTNSQERTV